MPTPTKHGVYVGRKRKSFGLCFCWRVKVHSWKIKPSTALLYHWCCRWSLASTSAKKSLCWNADNTLSFHKASLAQPHFPLATITVHISLRAPLSAKLSLTGLPIEGESPPLPQGTLSNHEKKKKWSISFRIYRQWAHKIRISRVSLIPYGASLVHSVRQRQLSVTLLTVATEKRTTYFRR